MKVVEYWNVEDLDGNELEVNFFNREDAEKVVKFKNNFVFRKVTVCIFEDIKEYIPKYKEE